MATQETNREASDAEAAAGQGSQEQGPPAAGGAASEGAASEGQEPRRAAAPRLIHDLAARGFGYVDEFLEPDLLVRLRARCLSLQSSGDLRPARIGRGAHERFAPEVRGDFISWLAEPELYAEQLLLARLEELRAALNRGLMAGLEDFQGHFALYPPGAAYARHSDRLVGTDVRAISMVLYLNEAWAAEDGGELRIHVEAGFEDILPRGGRLVMFQSDRFEHEVLPAQRERLSFTGWYRRRPLAGRA